ncbi:MAG: hypothetical protein IPJ97_15075 [Proteobacteria bacterium]|nr:hypothetical protein [Pseudomonadota bacterium]
MANDRHSESLASQRDRQVQLGLIVTALWVGAGVLYVAMSMGWIAFLRLPLGDLGDFLDGAFAPLAFLWLVLGLFLQQRELAANNAAIQRQFEVMQRTAEHAEIQTRAIAANELHARQDTFIDVAQMVMHQLEVIAGMLFISSQGTFGDGVVSDDEVDLMFARLSSGESSVFSRRMILLHVRLADSPDGWALFYGTPIRKQHCESYIRSFERLLLSAAGCDPEGMIVDALHGNAQGRLYRVMCTLRDSPPAGVSVAG